MPRRSPELAATPPHMNTSTRPSMRSAAVIVLATWTSTTACWKDAAMSSTEISSPLRLTPPGRELMTAVLSPE